MVYKGATVDMIKNPFNSCNGQEEDIQILLSKLFHTVDTSKTTVDNCPTDFCIDEQNYRTTGSSHST